MASSKFTQSAKRKGFIDQSYEFVKSLNFAPDLSQKCKNSIKSKRRPASPKKSTPVIVSLQALVLLGTLIPSYLNVEPLNFIPQQMDANPWGAQVGPLALGANLDALPKGAREVLPKFSGDGKRSTDEHLNAFNTTCAVLGIATKNVALRLFVQTLIDDATDWFHHLPQGSITNWATMRNAFEARFKSADDEHTLLLQLTQLKKEIHEPMRDFVAKFNKLIHKIPVAKRPNDENRKGFFVNAMPPDISFHLRRDRVADVDAAQRLAVELEDNILAVGKW